MTAKDCACLEDDTFKCLELRLYGYFPALLEDKSEACSCPCHNHSIEDSEGEQ